MSKMNVLGKYAIWQEDKFIFIEKPISFNKRTVVKVISCGLCGTDKRTLEELNIPGMSLGHEILAEIIYVGSNYKVIGGQNISVGDRVIIIPGENCGKCQYCGQDNLCQHRITHGWGIFSQNDFFAAGGFSSYIELMDNAWMMLVPNDIPDDVAVLAEPLGIAIRSVDYSMSMIRPEQNLAVSARVGVIGCGSIGYLIAYVLDSLGAHVVGFDSSPEKCDFFSKNLGFQSIHIPIEDANKIDQYISKKSLIQDFDLVFECGGTTSAFIASLIAVKKSGRVIELGNYVQNRDAEIDPSWICSKELDILGFIVSSPFAYKKVFQFLRRNSLKPLKFMISKIGLSDLNKIFKLDYSQQMKVIIQNDLL